VLGAVNPADLTTYVTNSNLYIYNPSSPYYTNLLKTLANGATLTSQGVTNDQVAIIVDRRTSNISNAKIQGIDFHVYYDTDTRIGRMSYGINGTKQTRADTTTSGVTTDGLGIGSPKLNVATFVGWNRGRMSGRLTVNYTGSYTDSGNDYVGVQESIKAFTQANLFLGYDFGESGGFMGGTSVRLSVDNLLEEKPQRIKRSNSSILDYANFTLGREIKLGVSKKF
jgi:iron complex outermembrane recepter protein